MPRKARIDAPGALHHIIVRGIERRRIFSDDQDRDNFIERMGDIVTDTKTFYFGWALIPNMPTFYNCYIASANLQKCGDTETVD